MGWLPGCNCRCGSSGSSGNGSSGGSSSTGPPPEVITDHCSGSRCSGAVMARNYRVEWDWPATIYPGEALYMIGDLGMGGPPGPIWSIRSYGSVCTSRYVNGGWIVKFAGAASPYGGCRWESDERLGVINLSPDVVHAGYPASCEDTAYPICYMTIGEPGHGTDSDFRVWITAPRTGGSYPDVTLLYTGRTVAEDGSTDCLAEMTLAASFYPVTAEAFVINGAFYDGSYTFDPNGTLPDSEPGYYRDYPPIPLTVRVTPV